jgi:hypothetical protein
VKNVSITTSALVLLTALVFAAPVLARPMVHTHDQAMFSVSQTLDPSCSSFFSTSAPTVDGWSGAAHESFSFTDPVYSAISIAIKGTWSDPTTGLSYRLHFDGANAGPSPFLTASGNVDIRRSDGRTLTGSAEFVADMQLVNLDSVSCS